jgi:hypothetical protein
MENTSSLKNGESVVHAGHVGGTLQVREILAGLLHAGVQVADDGLAPQHRLALELEHQPQHAVRARVLGPHVDDHGLVVFELGLLQGERSRLGLAHPQHGPDLAEELLGAHLAAGAELLTVLVSEADVFREGGHQRASGASLNCTGMRPVS